MAGGTGAIGSEEMTDNLLDVRQVAELLGLVPGSIYHKISRGELPFVRLSARCVRFRRCDSEAWISGKCVPPVASDAEGKKSR